MSNIGFIGTGIMGLPMARNLQNAGHTLFVSEDYKAAPASLIENGAKACATPSEVAKQSDVIITIVPDTPQVEAVLFGENGIAHGLSSGKTVIDMSSISPLATVDFAKRINELGCEYLDAPVSGGEKGAIEGALSIMVGGNESTFEDAKPILEILGKNITLVGKNGDGQTCKVANQIIVALNLQAVSEALVFASKAGADPAKIRNALMGGFASSRILEVHGERMINRTFEPGFRIGLHQKDLNLALQGAKEMGVSLPNTAIAQQMFSACVAQGGAEWDHSAMIKAIEVMSNHSLDG